LGPGIPGSPSPDLPVALIINLGAEHKKPFADASQYSTPVIMFNFFSSEPEVLFGNEPAQITVKNDGDDGSAHESLQTLLETRCKSVFLPFNPPWWLAK